MATLEDARKPKPSPFQIYFGSIDLWADEHFIPAIREGKVSASDMADVVAYARKWEEEGHCDAWRHDRVWERG
ncbi:MAG: hypothetical protein AAGL10_10735 [Pseudomonadota bacterium]